MKASEEKTNVMRLLSQHKIAYTTHYYADTDAVNGDEIVAVLGEDPHRTFKTLVTVGAKGEHYVFVVPVSGELDLKKAAAAVGEKSISMLKSKDLLPLTGYVHGGCSPIGMKKFFRTVIDKTAADYETFYISAGKIGYQVELNVRDLEKIIRFELKDIRTDEVS